MSENTAPAAPTDAELAAAIDRGITAGTIIVCDDAWLASQRAELDAEAALIAEHETQLAARD